MQHGKGFHEFTAKKSSAYNGPPLERAGNDRFAGKCYISTFFEKNINQDIDRVTLYRILKTFEEKGILHKIMDIHGTANYAMCSTNCSEGHHDDEHVHFSCTICQQLYCLKDFQLPELKLPPGYTAKNIDMLISGVCVNNSINKYE